ncbi:phospholipase A2 A2-actitoxin-Cgg2a-like [Physella acuta]|uniref:phospholipase A2 A2-actitoxin-Cgg2a-like n=1 Tax=Physella acuta TaxID=109671 RepID=UPI0027DE5380|nr:phospholipase A2 A2-actitoxin-Cgg2a-like [Physella acuta]
MYSLKFYFLMVLPVIAFQATKANLISKRDIYQLCKIFTTYTNRNCMDYSYYGCSCGPFKSGTPIDCVDRCCYQKKKCHAELNCGDPVVEVTCENGACKCTATDTNSCEYKYCMCDVAAAECLGRQVFNESLLRYDYSNCVQEFKDAQDDLKCNGI